MKTFEDYKLGDPLFILNSWSEKIEESYRVASCIKNEGRITFIDSVTGNHKVTTELTSSSFVFREGSSINTYYVDESEAKAALRKRIEAKIDVQQGILNKELEKLNKLKATI